MSYGVAAALQAAVYQALVAAPALSGVTVQDAAPSGTLAGTYVSLGPEEVRERITTTSGGAIHEFAISVVTDTGSFAALKEIAGAVSDALVDTQPAMSRGRVVTLAFLKASARRVAEGDLRRIDLTFRAHVEDD